MSNENSKQTSNQSINVVIVPQRKDVLVAFLLSFFLGPLGMLYSTVIGGVIMMFVSLVVVIFTFGFGLLITHPICVIWSVVAANSYNSQQAAQNQIINQ